MLIYKDKFFLLSIGRRWDYLQLFFSVAYLSLILVAARELETYHNALKIARKIVVHVVTKKQTKRNRESEAIGTIFVAILVACPCRCGALA